MLSGTPVTTGKETRFRIPLLVVQAGNALFCAQFDEG